VAWNVAPPLDAESQAIFSKMVPPRSTEEMIDRRGFLRSEGFIVREIKSVQLTGSPDFLESDSWGPDELLRSDLDTPEIAAPGWDKLPLL